MNEIEFHPQPALLDQKKCCEIDTSCRAPVLAFYTGAVFWLIIGTLFALVASIKFHHPEFISEWAFTTLGRIRPAHMNAVIFGWAASAGMGTAIWLITRLCQISLRSRWMALAAAFIWNIGVLVGIIGILAGESTSIKWLEFPTHAAFILFAASALLGVWAVDMFFNRKPGHIYISQLYLLAALLWFPWFYSTAEIMLVFRPVQGSVQGVIHWWFSNNILGLWFTPLALAAAYYIIPKIAGRPIYGYRLAILGFWSLALFCGWNGGHGLIGGPVPVWIISVGIVSSVMMLIPVAAVAVNYSMTVRGRLHLLRENWTLWFILFGAAAYVLAGLQGASMSMRSLSRVTHFTHYAIGHEHLEMYAFFTMIMFGAIYYIVPRLVQWEWPSTKLIRIHFWTVAMGVSLMFLSLTIGGLLQGFALETPSIPFTAITNYTMPFLLTRSGAGMLMAIGHIAFAISFILILLRYRAKHEAPTSAGIEAKIEKEGP